MEFDEAFTKKMVPKLDYNALVKTAKSINAGIELPDELDQNWETDQEFLRSVCFILTHCDKDWG